MTWPNHEPLCRDPHTSGATTDYAVRCDQCQMWCNAGWVKRCVGFCSRFLCERHRDHSGHCEECLKRKYGMKSASTPNTINILIPASDCSQKHVLGRNFNIHSITTYRCCVNETEVGTVSASDSLEARQKCKGEVRRGCRGRVERQGVRVKLRAKSYNFCLASTKQTSTVF